MGLQARVIIERLSPEQRWGSLVFGLSVLAVVIVVRIAWLVVYRAIAATIRRWRCRVARAWSAASSRPRRLLAPSRRSAMSSMRKRRRDHDQADAERIARSHAQADGR